MQVRTLREMQTVLTVFRTATRGEAGQQRRAGWPGPGGHTGRLQSLAVPRPRGTDLSPFPSAPGRERGTPSAESRWAAALARKCPECPAANTAQRLPVHKLSSGHSLIHIFENQAKSGRSGMLPWALPEC